MTVRLSWGNNNPTADSVKIYRATAPFADSALPAELATLAGNASTYDDTTAPNNTVVYYRAKITKGGDEHISPLMIMGHFPNTGPGPQTLLRGNWELGYFGRVPVANLWTVAQFRTAVGATALGAGAAESQLTFWHKFIRKGKILFVPSTYITSSTSWQDLYLLGLVYGTNDNGSMPAGLSNPPAPTNQQKVITLNGNSFLVRTPIGCTLPLDQLATAYATNTIGSEWDDTMGRSAAPYGNLAAVNRFDDVAASINQATITQHVMAINKTFVIRGVSSIVDSVSATTAYSWVPFVELIPT